MSDRSQPLPGVLAEGIVRRPEREARMLQLDGHEGLNMKAVGAGLGVTDSRVCRLHGQVAARVRVAPLAAGCGRGR